MTYLTPAPATLVEYGVYLQSVQEVDMGVAILLAGMLGVVVYVIVNVRYNMYMTMFMLALVFGSVGFWLTGLEPDVFTIEVVYMMIPATMFVAGLEWAVGEL